MSEYINNSNNVNEFCINKHIERYNKDDNENNSNNKEYKNVRDNNDINRDNKRISVIMNFIDVSEEVCMDTPGIK